MSRFRLIMLGVLAVAAINVVAATTASAAPCEKENKAKFVLCLGEPLVLTTGTFPLHVNGEGTSTLSTEVVAVKCSTILLTTEPTITGTATSILIQKLKLHFTGCEVPKPAKCAIQNELVLTLALAGVAAGKEVILFFPETGTHFATITFVNKGAEVCNIAGKLNVTGELGNHQEGPLCKANGIEKTSLLFLIECKEPSHLKLGEEAAVFKGNFSVLLLKEGLPEKWAVIEGK